MRNVRHIDFLIAVKRSVCFNMQRMRNFAKKLKDFTLVCSGKTHPATIKRVIRWRSYAALQP